MIDLSISVGERTVNGDIEQLCTSQDMRTIRYRNIVTTSSLPSRRREHTHGRFQSYSDVNTMRNFSTE